MIGERNGEVNATVFNAAIAARKKIAKLYYEDDDDFDEPIPKPAEDYAQKKRKVLEDVIKSCSPRVKNVMEAMLTGVRLAPVIAMRNRKNYHTKVLILIRYRPPLTTTFVAFCRRAHLSGISSDRSLHFRTTFFGFLSPTRRSHCDGN